MAVHTDHPINLIRDISDNIAQNTCNLGQLALPFTAQIGRPLRKQHLGGKDEPVAHNAYTVLRANHVSQTSKKLASIAFEVLLFGLKPDPLSLFQLAPLALFGRRTRQGRVEILPQVRKLNIARGVTLFVIIDNRLKAAKLRPQSRDLLIE